MAEAINGKRSMPTWEGITNSGQGMAQGLAVGFMAGLQFRKSMGVGISVPIRTTSTIIAGAIANHLLLQNTPANLDTIHRMSSNQSKPRRKSVV